MQKFEKILVSVTLLAMIFRIMLIPGGSEVFVIGSSILSLLYFYLSFALLNNIPFRKTFSKASYENLSIKRIFASVVTGVFISTALIGILFKFSFLPGADQMLTIGLTPLVNVTIILIILEGGVKKFKNYYVRAVPILIIGGMLYILPNETLISFLYRNHPTYVEVAIDSMNNPEDEKLAKKTDEERTKIGY